MKKLSLLLAALMITGASFACDGNKNCKSGDKCCKKEVAAKGKEAKACCKKNVADADKDGKSAEKQDDKKTAQK